MRIGALLFVGIGLLSAAACSATTSSDDVCTSAGGICLAIDAGLTGCGEQLSGSPCDDGFVCCTGGVPGTPAPTGDAAYPGTTTGDAATTPATSDAATSG